MSDLVEFLKARLDEDEQAAQAATPSPWRIDPRNPNVILEPTPIDSVGMAGERQHNIFTGQVSSRFGQAKLDVAHIVRHDPARVLAEVAAKRRIIEALGIAERNVAKVRRTAPDYRSVRVAEAESDAMLHAVRLLAHPYADHPDYREDWELQ